MKKLKKFALGLMAVLMAVSMAACSDKDDPKLPDPEPAPTPTPTPTPEPEPEVNPFKDYRFDIWATIGSTSGMGSTSTLVVKNVDDVTKEGTISFDNQGTDVSADLFQESIVKGKYYYQIPVKNNRFGKYEILDDGGVKVVAERPFAENTYSGRKYCHAWIGEKELVIMAANGDANDVIWTKLQDNGTSLDIMAEGSLKLPEHTEIAKYATSGLATYRASDNKILYITCEKNSKKPLQIALVIIDAATMEVEAVDFTDVAEEMSGTAYGELLQDKMFLDDNDDLYLPLVAKIPDAEKSTCRYSRIVRVKKGENKFDSWVGFNTGENNGKIVTSSYAGNGKALFYIQDPEHTGISGDNKLAEGWGDNYNCYYAIYDIASGNLTELEYNGKKLPYCAGTFSQRTYHVGDYTLIGLNPDKDPMDIMIYNSKTGEVTKGATVAAGYEFSRLVAITK